MKRTVLLYAMLLIALAPDIYFFFAILRREKK